jgi:hypothetical protein
LFARTLAPKASWASAGSSHQRSGMAPPAAAGLASLADVRVVCLRPVPGAIAAARLPALRGCRPSASVPAAPVGAGACASGAPARRRYCRAGRCYRRSRAWCPGRGARPASARVARTALACRRSSTRAAAAPSHGPARCPARRDRRPVPVFRPCPAPVRCRVRRRASRHLVSLPCRRRVDRRGSAAGRSATGCGNGRAAGRHRCTSRVRGSARRTPAPNPRHRWGRGHCDECRTVPAAGRCGTTVPAPAAQVPAYRSPRPRSGSSAWSGTCSRQQAHAGQPIIGHTCPPRLRIVPV